MLEIMFLFFVYHYKPKCPFEVFILDSRTYEQARKKDIS